MRSATSLLPFGRMLPLVATCCVATGLLLGAASRADADYVGYGDTGWSWDNKRDCCDDAAELAQQNSADMCRNAGGRPYIPRGSIRAFCDWDSDYDDQGRVYRCTAKTSVDCD